mmetsp:Transcript_14269/g.26903  ORF Transcript_14269/g.26903 Transcript_14269/m.26903 type:complete len:298 (-) Transcript_14269:1414-2307(-)
MLLNKDYNLTEEFTPSLTSVGSFKAKLESLKPKVFRKKLHSPKQTAETKLSLVNKTRQRTRSKTDAIQDLSPIKVLQRSSSFAIKPTGGSLYASHANDKLKLCLDSLGERRKNIDQKQMIELDLKEAIKTIENSPYPPSKIMSDMKTTPSATMLKSRATKRRLSGPFTGRSTDFSVPESSRDIPSTFLTSVNMQRRSLSRFERSQSKSSLYTERIENLMSTCANQMTERQASNKNLADEEEKLLDKYTMLKSRLEQPEAFVEGYILSQVSAFRREKPAFIYGRDFKGRYIPSLNRLR